ncbi:MAG: glycosyltransferase family 1 protein [Treponema sp.]|nr:glycosyltransferase family 1 protein [Treponema sp.]
MRIALVHYHLRRGGVTSVLHNQARAFLGAGEEVLVVSGEAPRGSAAESAESAGDFPCAVVEGLAYDAPGAESSTPEEGEKLAGAILRSIEERWKGGADVIHVHNPLIRKNSRLLPALRFLAARGIPLLLQNHDFAEDFRPDVYTGGIEYPENCHYAVINSRDYACLHRAGLKPEGLHLLPNEVNPVTAAGGLERTRYLYPVRGIRRKNVGEALLLSLFIPRGKTVTVTLPPPDGSEGPWLRWMRFAGDLELPVEFGAGLNYSLAELYGSSCRIITTSVKEGFGFSFLEPWTAGRSLSGRRIDYVCEDFEGSGLHFDSLYSSIRIPLEYISVHSLSGKMEKALEGVYAAFGLEMPFRLEHMMKEEFAASGTIDFGRMDEETQESVIRILFFNKEARRDIVSLNPFLAELAGEDDGSFIEYNREVVERMYSGERVSRILLDTCRSVPDHPVVQKLSKQMLLDLYLDPLRFSLIGTGSG